MPTIFLPLEVQETIFLIEKIVFAFSISLNALAFAFLLKQTPPNQSTFRNYLISIQVLVIMTDLVLGLLSEPIILFPVWGGYCCGWMCRIVTAKTTFGIVVLLLATTGAAIIICCLYRHQTILFDSSTFKMRTPVLHTSRIVLLALFNCGPIRYILLPEDHASIEQSIDEARLGWVRERNCSYLVENSSLSNHMFLMIIIASAKRSTASVVIIRKSLTVLFIQLVVPLSLVVVPAQVQFFGMAIPELVSFEVCLAMFEVMHLHSIWHNIILLSITRTYRKAIVRFFTCLFLKTRTTVIHLPNG